MLVQMTKSEILTLGSIMFLCLCALLWGLNGDSPICSEHDEFCFAPPAVQMVISQDLNPHTFINPASTLIYPLAAYYSILKGITGETYIDTSTPSWKLCCQHMDMLIKWPRLLSAFLLLASLPLLYAAGRNWVGKSAAMLAVLFYAFSPLVVYYAQILRPDMIANFFICLGMLLLGLATVKPTDKVLAAGLGACAGLATSTRYFCLALMPTMVIAYGISLFGKKEKGERKAILIALFVALFLWITAFACTSPFFFLDFHQVMDDIRFESQSVFSDVAGLTPLGNLRYYLNEAFPESMGTILMCTSGIGLLLLLLRVNKKTIVYSFLLTVFLVGTCLNSRHWNRWAIPMLPIMFLLAAFAICQGYELMSRLLQRIAPTRLSHWLSLSACLAFSMYGYFFPFRHMLAIQLEKWELTGRARTFLFIKDKIPKGSKIVCDMSWDWPDRDEYTILENVWRPDFVPPRPHNYYLPADLAKEGYQYMVVLRWNREDYAITEPDKYPREGKFFQDLVKQAPLLFSSFRTKPNVMGESVPDTYSPVEIYDLRPLASGK